MRWENLKKEEFASAVEKSGGVCVMGIGCLEKHGEHLPVETDVFIADEIVSRAEKLTDFVSFPVFKLGDMIPIHRKADPYETDVAVILL